jgi:uncharacterized membrane protein
MDSRNANGQSSEIAYLTLVVLVLVFCFVVFLDIPIARQVIGFLFVTFIPGFVFLKILKVNMLNKVELALFSIGMSIAFLMIFGFLISEFFFAAGFSNPLSLLPLMVFFSSFVLVGGILVYLRKGFVTSWKLELPRKIPSILLFLCLPILSIVGATCVNVYGRNSILLFAIVSISVLFIGGVLSKRLLPSKLYPFAVLTIAIAILYHATLISNYIISYGSDIPLEYLVFKTTQSNANWSLTNPFSGNLGMGRYYSMLSITVLPTVYSNLLNMDQMIFKILFPLIFSLVPLALYQLWKEYVGARFAFISAFLFMAESTFYFELISLTRQMIAELFFVILLLVILNKKIKPASKIVCFMIFSFALITSHYALAEIFLFFIAFTAISLIALKRPSKSITFPMIVFFFVLMFTWYIFTSGSATFDSFMKFGDNVVSQLGDFFNPLSRGETVMVGLGLAAAPSIFNTISRVFAYLIQALIILGFIGLIAKRIKVKIEKEYFVLSVTSIVVLAMLLIIPGLAGTLNMTRFYHLLLFFLAPFCVIGSSWLLQLVFKRERKFVVAALLLTVLVPYFLFQTNFVYEVTGSPSWSLPLSGYRMNALQLYSSNGFVDAHSAYGAKWLSTNVNLNTSRLFADERTSVNILVFFGGIGAYPLSNTTSVADHGVVYLGTMNVVGGVFPFGRLSWNSSELSHIFSGLDVIYSNGDSVIYGHSP